MVADIKIKFNTINATNYLKKISRNTPKAIKQSLARVSAYGVKQITEKTQKGQSPVTCVPPLSSSFNPCEVNIRTLSLLLGLVSVCLSFLFICSILIFSSFSQKTDYSC